MRSGSSHVPASIPFWKEEEGGIVESRWKGGKQLSFILWTPAKSTKHGKPVTGFEYAELFDCVKCYRRTLIAVMYWFCKIFKGTLEGS